LRTGAARTRLAFAACCAAAALACGARNEKGGAELPTAAIHVGNHRLRVEVADTPASRGRGLMFRSELPDDRGMLFVFPEEKVLEFWMRNTEIPLSIAFADASGRIVRIADMEPRSEEIVSSVAPARYALEVKRGWFDAHGVRSGDSLGHLPAQRAE
jgi:uncharacterized membrane protein (UPF0127 family)